MTGPVTGHGQSPAADAVDAPPTTDMAAMDATTTRTRTAPDAIRPEGGVP
jgi:hypothetical protein